MSDVNMIAEIGMITGMEQLKVISNNIANATNNGFKRDIYVNKKFDSTLASLKAPQNIKNSIVTDMRQGSMEFTGGSLDIAIQGNAFLQLSTNQGIVYTRNGSLTLDSAGRLVSKHGSVVNGMDGEIRLNSPTPRIDDSGKVWEEDKYVGQLKLVTFSNLYSLNKAGEGLYTSSMPGQNIDPENTNMVRQGYLETSNVNVMHEMVGLTSLVRQIEAMQKAMSAYDGMLNTAIRDIAVF